MAKKDLKPFKKGNDPRRNVTGKNKGSSWLKNKLIKALQKVAEGSSNSCDDLLIKKMLVMAIKEGNEQIIKLIWEYLEEKPVARTEEKIEVSAKHTIYAGKSVDTIQAMSKVPKNIDEKEERKFNCMEAQKVL